ncbi:hypothetical protein GOP47_0006466 [Adiantum capillus-veneris]|uniref:tRNA (guanine(37)-N1)-methyltransferase n=1 Tax=Adiantum capillus-veneris TaxID=13818 RepID=A0A9D4V2X8_ADICA|nr:hypothetical protein GOP47_0006466 [Adiantum capillus-veneris]
MVLLHFTATPTSLGWRELHQGLCFKLWSARKLPRLHAICESLSYRLSMSTAGKCPTRIENAAEALSPGEFPIDKSKFDVPYNLLALRVPKQHSGSVSKLLSGFVFSMPRVRHIIPDPSNSDARLVILSDKVSDSSLSEIPAEKLASLRSVTDFEVIPHQVMLGYNYWPADHILKALLPDGCEIQSAFETIGHIAHLNIRDELAGYKHLIASVILEKNKPKIRTVLNKVGTITNQFRVPTFEVLAGDPSLITEVKQYGATFRVDYGLVYWNSRLEHEHIRLVSQFLPKQVICDMFAGIGPFAIPAAQKGCIVYANDLNPDSVKYLQVNTKINKVSSKVYTFNMDARDFVRHIVNWKEPPSGKENEFQLVATEECKGNEAATVSSATRCEGESKEPKSSGQGLQASDDLEHATPWEHIDHIVMNLPASALDFLDVFRGLLTKESWKGMMPRVHCYCFMRAHETVRDVLKHAESVLGCSITNPTVWEVRDVAPNKAMLCLSFNLPEEVAFMKSITDAECATPTASGMQGTIKRPRLEEARISSSYS